MSEKNNKIRKEKIELLFLRDKIEQAIKTLSPLYSEYNLVLKNFTITDNYIFESTDDILDDKLNFYLDADINYEVEIEEIITLLEKSYFINPFFSKTLDLIKQFCLKIENDFKLINSQNIQ